MKKKFASAIIIFLLFVFSFANASLYIELSPEYPKPGSAVSAKVQDLNIKSITWLLDDEKLADNTNEVKFKIDKKKKLTAILSFENQKTQKIERIIEPIDLNLLYEPETYAPRALQISPFASFGSKIKLWAILNSDEYKTENLIFNWYKNGEFLRQNSGLGKDYTEIELGIFDDKVLVSLELFDPKQNKIITKENLVVLLKKPELLLYSKNLLGWDFQSVIGKDFFLGKSAQILAVPFSAFAKNIFDENLIWKWSLGAQEIKEATSPYIEIERQSNQDAELTVSFRHRERLLQSAQKSVIIKANSSKQEILNTDSIDEDSAFGI